MQRRSFLLTGGAALAGGLRAARPAGAQTPPAGGAPAGGAPPDWEWVRAQFDLAPDYVHMSSFFITSHPRSVREEIEKHRRAIDANPFLVVEHGFMSMPARVSAAAAEYLGGRGEEVALTDSTTMGLALIYAGLPLSRGQELLTTTHDHYVHHEAIRLAARRAGASTRRVALYDDSATAGEDQMAERLRRALRPETRVVGLTWVHSSTGVKLPLRAMAGVLAEANRQRGPAERALLVVDGVHGFGVEDETIAETGCDFFAAGTHKWIFGPRGTGVVWGRHAQWPAVQPTIPSFDELPYMAWLQGQASPGPTQASWVSPGGFKPFEHVWALPAAFEFHRRLGRRHVAGRIHQLNSQCKEGLAAMRHVRLHTPRSAGVSSGIVCFEVEGMSASAAVARLLERRVLASVSPYATPYVRLAPSLVTSAQDVEATLRAVRSLAAA